MVEEVLEFPAYLSKLHSTLIDWTPTQKTITRIPIVEQEDIWLIKVNKDRCPVCGTVEKSKKEWCDPRPDNFWEDCL